MPGVATRPAISHAQVMDAKRAPLTGTHTLLTGTQAPLAGAEAALIGLVALFIVLIPFLWPLAEHLNVMAHEGAHAAAGSLLGFAPLGVELTTKATGGTSFPASMRGLREVLIGTIGYLGPSLFGLWAAKLIATGHAIAVLWIAVILLAALLFMIRKSFGLVSVPAAIAVLAIVGHGAQARLEEVISYGMSWLLLLSGVRVAVADGIRAMDAAILAAITPLPRRAWALIWLAGTLLAVVIGGKWLVGL
jgi:hypothetical protein